jgi:integrase
MALKGQQTKSDFIEWEKLQTLILKLERDGNKKFALLIAMGIYTGFRISDILSLKWKDVVAMEFVEVVEKKTKKFRKVRLNQQLQEIVSRIYSKEDLESLIFQNRFHTSAISVQYVNRKLKELATEYKVSKEPTKIKSHSLRKSFGRRVFENNDNSEKSLILLSECLNHSSLKITRTYLGIRDKEIYDIYEKL